MLSFTVQLHSIHIFKKTTNLGNFTYLIKLQYKIFYLKLLLLLNSSSLSHLKSQKNKQQN